VFLRSSLCGAHPSNYNNGSKRINKQDEVLKMIKQDRGKDRKKEKQNYDMKELK
jgi:hypothetical protein